MMNTKNKEMKNNRPTILVLSDTMHAGGMERQIVELLKGLRQRGNFNKFKDQTTLIKAMPEILDEFPEAKLILVGRDRGTLNYNRSVVEKLGLAKSVIFITNTSHPEPFIAGSDAWVLLSPFGEGFSNVIIEYMALVKPVLATDCGGNREIIKHGVNGYLLQDGNTTEISEKVAFLFSNLKQAKEMGRRGKGLVRK